MNICAMFFSGTGTTEKIVTTLAEHLSRQLQCPQKRLDFTPPAARQNPPAFSAEDLVILGVPVIAGRVPNLLLRDLRGIAGGGALGVPVVLFGNRSYDDALLELRDIMAENGFRPIAAGAFVGEHSFSRTLGQGRPDADDLAEAVRFADQIAEKLRSGSTALPDVPGQTPLRPYYTPRDRAGRGIDIRRVKPKTGSACIRCGWCAATCPLGSISAEDPSIVSGTCMKCCKCIKGCPQGAKYFDDPGYLYHKEELEALYGGRRAQNEVFLAPCPKP